MAQNITSFPWAIDEIRRYGFTGHRRPLSRYRRRRYYEEDELEYIWERDFPIKLQNEVRKLNAKHYTIFTTVFSLNESEKKAFKKIAKKTLAGNLKVSIKLGFDSAQIRINDDKFPKKVFTNTYEIQRFFSSRIQVQYISAIRTPAQTLSTIDDMISSQLSILQKTKKYQDVLKRIQKLQKPILEDLSEKLTASVSAFLPQVKKIELDSRERVERIIRESTDVHVDDGTNTLLELKGDGIKSLMAISIIQHTTLQKALKKNIVLVIEEPESHLHPDAIHKLHGVLREISTKNQVIISTHSPLLVNRSEISRNILVDKSQAIAAKNIADIRKILGVRIADNLQSASLIILVEGSEDEKIISICVSGLSPNVKKAIDQGKIAFDSLGGGTNLSYKISLWKNLLCDTHVFLDNDFTGNKSYEDAEKRGLITQHDVTFASLLGFKESEIEDLIDPSVYSKDIQTKFGVDLDKSPKFRSNKKWSIRMKESFKAKNKLWNDRIEKQIKTLVTENFVEKGIKGIHKRRKGPFNSLIDSINQYFESSRTIN